MPNEYEDAVRYAVEEIKRIAKLDTREVMRGMHFYEAMASLPHPSGCGNILCEIEAYRRLRRASNLAVARSHLAGRLDTNDAFKALKRIVSERFLRDGRDISQKQCDRAFSASIKEAEKNTSVLRYFLPVHLGSVRSPAEFTIGPVRFSLMDRFLSDLDTKTQTYLDELIGDAKLKEDLLNHSKDYYRAFGWVSEVEIEKSSPTISRVAAKRRVQNAIDYLHLHLGASHSDHIRVEGPNFFTDRRGHIVQDENEKIDVSVSVDWRTNSLPENWWEWLIADGGGELNSLFGQAIKYGSDLSKPSPLAQRVLDGLAWFGEAVRDEHQASRIVKYVTAMERILVTEEKTEKLVDTLSRRGAALIFDPDKDNLCDLVRDFKEIYDLRSELVHGARFDLPPIIRSRRWVSFPVFYEEGRTRYEAQEIYGRADYFDLERGGGRDDGQGGLPSSRYFGEHVLPLEVEVWGDDGFGRQAAA